MLYKNSIVPLFAALLVLQSSLAQAGVGRLRSSRQERSLKSSKGSVGSSGMGPPSPWHVVTGEITGPAPEYPLSIEAFNRKCPNQSNVLDLCVARAGGSLAYQSLCKTCVIAIAHFSSPTINALNSCSNPNINGGYCRECYEDVKNYYNCGTDSSLGAGTTPEPDDDDGFDASSNSGVTGGSGGSGDVFPVGTYAPPETHCPLYAPESGDACSVPGYDYLECYFPRLKCTCRNDSPFYLCVEYESSQESPETRPAPGNTPETPQDPPEDRPETRPAPGNTPEPRDPPRF